MVLNSKELSEMMKREESALLKRWKSWASDSDAKPIRDGWSFVHEALPQVRLYNAGGVVPFQAEGIVGDYGFYLRERGGYPSLALVADSLPFGSGEVIYFSVLPEEVTVSRDNFVEIFEKLYARLEKRAPLWAVKTIVNGVENSYPSRGWSAEEAMEGTERYFNSQKSETIESWIEYFSNFNQSQEQIEKRARESFDYHQNLSVDAVSAVFHPDLESTTLEELKNLPEFDEVRIDLREKN